MRYEFLKDHVNHVAGDVDELEEGLANYLLAVGVVQESKKEKKVTAPPPKKTVEPAKEKRAVRDMDLDTVEKVKKSGPQEKKKDAGPLEPVVNSKPDKHEIASDSKK